MCELCQFCDDTTSVKFRALIGLDPIRFWVFHTPDKPVVYIPNYDALLVPAAAPVPYSLQSPPAVLGLADALQHQPPRRRRPILALLDLLQKRYNLNQADQPPPLTRPTNGFNGFGGVKKGEEEGNSTSLTQLNSTLPLSEPEGEKEKEDGCKQDNATTESTEELETTEANPDVHDEVQLKDAGKVTQITKIYSLLDSLIKDHPEVKDGFSYAYKYRVPHAPSSFENVELSVQQSFNRFPTLSEDPEAQKVLRKPVDYEKAQHKLDSILENNAKKGTPVHLNTVGAYGPLLLNQYLENNPIERKAEGKEKEKESMETPETSDGRKQKTTKLMLRPVAKAVAGPKGIAVASPLARAILRRGQRVTVEYEPDAVAIAGPGGRAHAHPQFSMEYVDKDGEY